MAIERAHTLIAKFGADTKADLVRELRLMAGMIERDEITTGCSGSPDAGTIYSYKHDPAMTHDEYFRQVEAEIEAERTARAAQA